MVTWLPRWSATTPRRRSINARFCPYCPNRTEASLLSSNASTVWVVAVSSEAAAEGITESGVRKGVSSSCCGKRGGVHFIGKRAKKAVAADFGDGHALDRSDQAGGRHDMDCLQIWGAANDLPRQFAGLFQQHIDGAAGEAGIKTALVAGDGGLQPLQAVGLLVRRHLAVHFGRRRSGSRRIRERICTRKADVIDERKGLPEICVGLAREAHDEIGGEGEIGAPGTQSCNDLKIIPACMFSAH